VDAQIRSLAKNSTHFTLHWLDDHSSDNTRDMVRKAARASDIALREWRSSQHQGVPGAFFHLLECVSADIYLFCDQDDIWQPGKIDATVANLLPSITKPMLAFSEPLIFREDRPDHLRRLFDVTGMKAAVALQETRAFLSNPSLGNTIGLTRPLREIFLRHKDIARSYAAMHDWWMYHIALASGQTVMLSDVPTTLYRMHGKNAVGVHLSWRDIANVTRTLRSTQAIRRHAARHAEGFYRAAKTLPQGAKLDRMLALAQLVISLDRRQSAWALFKLFKHRAMPSVRALRIWLTISCLCTDVDR
jgi:glycosyltransferase involved in cell wall biosynthesis